MGLFEKKILLEDGTCKFFFVPFPRKLYRYVHKTTRSRTQLLKKVSFLNITEIIIYISDNLSRIREGGKDMERKMKWYKIFNCWVAGNFCMLLCINRQQTPHSLTLMILPCQVIKGLQANNQAKRAAWTPQITLHMLNK